MSVWGWGEGNRAAVTSQLGGDTVLCSPWCGMEWIPALWECRWCLSGMGWALAAPQTWGRTGRGSWSCSSLQDRPGAGGDPRSGCAAEGGPVALGRAHPTAPLLEPGGSQEKTPWNMQGLLRRGAAGGWTRGCQALGRADSRGLMSWHGSRRDEGVRVSSIPESLSPASGAGAGAAGSVTPPEPKERAVGVEKRSVMPRLWLWRKEKPPRWGRRRWGCRCEAEGQG